MSPTPPEYILHIGLHKTGTTSFQAVMHNHRQDFLAQGIDPFQTPRGIAAGRAKHGELAFATIRPGVLDQRPGDLLYGFSQPACFSQTQAAIAAYVAASSCRRFLFSAETLSLLRTPEEMARLKALFPPGPATFTILLGLRDKAEWLESYSKQAIKAGIEPSLDNRSAFYLAPDTWLADFDRIAEVFGAAFDRLISVNYSAEDMVGKLAEALGVRLAFNTRAYRRNVSPRNAKAARLPRYFLKRALGSEDQGLRRLLRDLRERWSL